MTTDISPLTPVPSTPLVREKRHYPGEQKEQAQQKQQNSQNQEKPSEEADKEEKSLTKKPVDIDEKDVTVRHIDEYA